MELARRHRGGRPSGMIRMFQAIQEMRDAGETVLDLSIGEPDFPTELDIVDEAARAGKEGFTHYPPLQGYLDLRESICAYWERHHGLRSSPSEVYVSVGALHAPWLAWSVLLEPGDEVLLIEPYFTPYALQVSGCGGVPVAVPTSAAGGFVPTIDALREAAGPRTRGLVLNFPCNPTGSVPTRERLEEIATFAEERGLIVLSDETYESMSFARPHTCFATLPGMSERTLTVSGVSKSHCMTGWRLGYVFAPPDVIRTMCVLSTHQTYGVNTLAQKAARYALDAHDAKVAERADVFARRMEAVRARLDAMDGLSCPGAEGAFYLFPSVAGTGLSSQDLAWRLFREARVAVVPGDAFGPSGEGHVRVACTQPMETLMAAMDAMERFVASL